MLDYLKCMRFTENLNAPNCRVLAKKYLKCRMDNQLMEQSEWDTLGLVNLPNDIAESKKKKDDTAQVLQSKTGSEPGHKTST